MQCRRRKRPEPPSAAVLGVARGLGWLSREPVSAESTPSLGPAAFPFPGCITLGGTLTRGFALPLTSWPALPHRGPPCRPVAAQVKGDRHDLCQHQLCLLQLQRPQLVSAPSLTQLPIPGVKFHPEREEPATVCKKVPSRGPARRLLHPEADGPLLWHPQG